MPQCSSCRRVISAKATSCPACLAPVSPSQRAAAARQAAPSSADSSAGRLAKLLVVGLIGGGALVFGYYWVKVRPRLQPVEAAAASRPKQLDAGRGAIAGADLSLRLPGEPHGLAWTGKGFVVARRDEPGGFLRVTPGGESFDTRQVVVKEPAYGQKLYFHAAGWNGSEVVALTTGSWFQEADAPVFTVHDAQTLAVKRHAPAPAQAGSLAWDGSGWWVGTRKNTPEEAGEPLLQQLDASFAVQRTLAAPARGCQGLAWDGTHLWWADVFDDALLQLDVSGDEAVVVARHALGASYPSGLAWDGRRMWLCEYEKSSLHRLVLGGGQAVSEVADIRWESAPATGTPTGAPAVAPAESDDVEVLMAAVREGSFGTSEAAVKLDQLGHREMVREVLREMLWSDEGMKDHFAGEALRALGLPVDRARYGSIGSPDTGPQDTDLLDLRTWFEGDDLHASWQVHVGEELLAGVASGTAGDGMLSMPTFAKYTVTTRGGTLGQEVAIEYDADSSEISERSDEVLATGLGPGEYDVSVFIHVQTDVPGEGPKIFNNSAGSVSVER